MKRKKIEQIPLVERTLSKTAKEYTVYTGILESNGIKTLIMDLYSTNSGIKETMPPVKRYVTDGKDYETYLVEEQRWTKAGLMDWCWSIPGLCFPPGQEEAVHEMFQAETWKGIDPVHKITANEEQIKRDRSDKKWNNRKKAVNNRIAMVKGLPTGAERWFRTLFEKNHYIFYKTESSMRAVGTCSNCKKTIEFDRRKMKPVHNAESSCPNCRKKIIFKAAGLRPMIEIEKKAIVMQKIDCGFASRYYALRYKATVEGESMMQQETVRVTYNGKRIYEDFSNGNFGWRDTRTGVQFGTGYLYTKNIEEVLRDTSFRYCAIGILQDHTDGPINQKNYLSHYETAPCLEYITKMGLYHLANEYAERRYTQAIRSCGRKPEEILMIDKQKINRLIQINGGLEALKILQVEEQIGRTMTKEELELIDRYKVNTEKLLEIAKITGIGKFLNYLKKQLINKKESFLFLSDWLDYIGMCRNEGEELTDFILYPRDLKKAHDDRIAAIRIKNDEDKNRNYQILKAGYKERLIFSYKGLEIVVPESLEDIINEGNEQHHCVAMYVDRVSQGNTIILFVRRSEKREEPFYTMEVNDNQVIQCRGKYNKDPSVEIGEEVRKFVQAFNKKLKKLQERIKIPA